MTDALDRTATGIGLREPTLHIAMVTGSLRRITYQSCSAVNTQ